MDTKNDKPVISEDENKSATEIAFEKFKQKESEFVPEIEEVESLDEPKKELSEDEKDYSFKAAMLIKLLNFLFTGINLLVYNYVVSGAGKKMKFSEMKVDDDEFEIAEAYIEEHAKSILDKFPDELAICVMIESSYIEKMIDFNSQQNLPIKND